MTNAELKELVHLLLMCGIMDKTATENGNVTNDEWLRMKNLISKYQEENASEVKGDLISRKALKETFDWRCDKSWDGALIFDQIKEVIDNAPTVESERPKGEWLKSGKGKTKFFCSECGREIDTKPFTRPDNFPFCHCGAKMQKGGAE